MARAQRPDGDLTPLDIAAVAMHELYESFRRAGFARTEAMTIISKMGVEIVMQQVAEEHSTGEPQDPDGHPQ